MFERTRAMWRHFWHRNDSRYDGRTDRRNYPRMVVDREATCRIATTGESESFMVRVRNISKGGINILCDRRLRPGTLLHIALPLHEDGTASAVLACVMHTKEEGAQSWSMGCSFSAELDDCDLAELGGKREFAPPSDPRTYARFSIHGYATYQRMRDEKGTVRKAEITNVSASGVGLLVDESLQPGTVLNLGLQRKDGGPRYAILGCVVYVGERNEGGYVVGCNFIHEITERDMAKLL